MQTRMDVNPDRAGFYGVGVVLFFEVLKVEFNPIVLCLSSRRGSSNYVSYNRDSRKRERLPFTMTMQFEFERKRSYVIIHGLHVNQSGSDCRADHLRFRF